MKNSIRALQREVILIVDWNISIYFSKWKKSNKHRSWKNMFLGNRETWVEGNVPILKLLLMVLLLYYILLIHLDEERILYFQNSSLVSNLLLTCKSFKELKKNLLGICEFCSQYIPKGDVCLVIDYAFYAATLWSWGESHCRIVVKIKMKWKKKKRWKITLGETNVQGWKRKHQKIILDTFKTDKISANLMVNKIFLLIWYYCVF